MADGLLILLCGLSNFNLFLDQSWWIVNEFVKNSCHGEDTTNDGTKSRQKMTQWLFFATVLDHHRWKFIWEKYARHSTFTYKTLTDCEHLLRFILYSRGRFTCHDTDNFGMPRHTELIGRKKAPVWLSVSCRYNLRSTKWKKILISWFFFKLLINNTFM